VLVEGVVLLAEGGGVTCNEGLRPPAMGLKGEADGGERGV